MPRLLIVSLFAFQLGTYFASADTPIFFGPVVGETAKGVDAERLYEHLGIDTGDAADENPIGPDIAHLSKQIIDRIDSDDRFVHFARPVEVWEELPDDVLLLVIAVEAAEEQYIDVSLDEYGRTKAVFEYPVLAATLQLADPRTGQVIYSDFELVSGVYDFRKSPELARLSRGEIIDEADRAIWRQEPGRTWAGQDTAYVYAKMLEHVAHGMLQNMLSKLDPTPVRAQVVRFIDKKRGLLLVNRGRAHGVFINSRMASSDGSLVLAVQQSYPSYSIARVVRGSPGSVQPWTQVRGYQAVAGSGNTLTAVSRIVLSPDIVNHPKLARLKVDESCLQASLAGKACSPVYQSLMATRLTEALARTGQFRLAYPMGGLASLKRAKDRMNTALNLKQREGDPFFFESFVIPDQVVVCVLSSPLIGSKPYVMQGKASDKKMQFTELVGSLHLCDVRSGRVIASGSAKAGDHQVAAYVAGTAEPLRVPASLAGQMLRSCVLDSDMEQSIFRVAVDSLVSNYQPVDSTAHVVSSTSTSVRLSSDTPGALAIGEAVDICVESGQLALEAAGSRKTPILTKVGWGSVVSTEGGDWIVELAVETDHDMIRDFPARAPLYSRNSKQLDSLDLGVLQVAGKVAPGIPMSDVDASLLLLAGLADHPDLPVSLPDYVRRAVDAFQRVKFVEDVAYRDANSLDPLMNDGDKPPPAYTLQLHIATASAPVVPSSRTSTEKMLATNCRVVFSFTDSTGKEVCDPGTVRESKEKRLPIDEFEGFAFARTWIDNVVEQKLPGYIARRMAIARRKAPAR